MKTLYTTKATVKGGRNGHAETDDKTLSLDLSPPGAPSQKSGATNPEQLFACGYAACFGSAVEAVARKQKINASEASITVEIKLQQEPEGGYRIAAALEVSIPGLDAKAGQQLVEEAHQMCPYSKATRGNIDATVQFKAADGSSSLSFS